MRNVKKAIQRNLLEWYGQHARDLPWRRVKRNRVRPDAYTVWVSEVMLQQTRIEQGLPYFERFMKRFPRVEDLAAASEDEVLKLWEGLGYYARARNLRRCARIVVENHHSRFPDTAEDLEKLPGIGRYTAGAIASIAFGKRAAILDGNIIRVLSRIFNIDTPVDDAATRKLLWSTSEALVPEEGRYDGLSANPSGDFNQAMMELGAQICLPKAPRCAECPLRKQCKAFRAGIPSQRPIRRPKKNAPHQEIVVAAIKKNGRYLLGKRPPKSLLGGLWEFPGGKVKPAETHEQALMREVREELDIEISVGGLIACVQHAYSHLRVTLNVYRCTHLAGVPRPHFHTELKWVLVSQFPRYAFPKANHKFLHLLAGRDT